MRMKWWKTFLRNRKQNDRVKLELAAILLGLTGMILAMVHGVALYQRLQTRMEYVLSSEGSVSQQNDRMICIRKLPSVEAVSRQVGGIRGEGHDPGGGSGYGFRYGQTACCDSRRFPCTGKGTDRNPGVFRETDD